MKRWTETKEVMDHLTIWSAAGHRAAIATVVQVAGSAYRREGAKLLVRDDGVTRGNVSGGCLEQDVLEVALRVLETGQSELRSYCSGADVVEAWDLGVGCEGRVDVFITPAAGDDARLRELLEAAEESFAVASLVDIEMEEGATDGETPSPRPRRLLVTAEGEPIGSLGDSVLDRLAGVAARDALATEISGIAAIGSRQVFVEMLRPPPRLVVFGAGDDARPLVTLATTVGFRVTVVDRRPALLAPERFSSGTRLVTARAEARGLQSLLGCKPFVVLMTHNYADDLAYLESILSVPTSYIGMLGPRQRTERILDTLRMTIPVDADRVHGPIGLDLGGEGAEAVAVAIIAEILTVKSGRLAEPLRDRTAPIHADA